MTRRNLNPHVFLDRAAAAHRPRYRFEGKTRQDFEAWRSAALPEVLATLGRPPQRVDPRPELLAEWTDDGLVKQRWVIDTQPDLAATVLVFRPEGMAAGERRPAILCCHGHGPLGKDGPMGIVHSAEAVNNIKFHNYDYGLQMARKGFVTYSLDWFGFGERNIAAKPHYYHGTEGRDPCNIYYLCATLLGTTVLALNCHDGARATDLVCAQPYVDPARLGVMGLSLGGTMATWMALTDERIKAADIMGYAGPWYDIAFRTYNVCGSQVAPGLHALVDVSDLQGLIAPRPVLVELGLFDSCFEADYTQEAYRQMERIYAAAGLADRLELDLFPGEHAWGARKSESFFTRHLGPLTPAGSPGKQGTGA